MPKFQVMEIPESYLVKARPKTMSFNWNLTPITFQGGTCMESDLKFPNFPFATPALVHSNNPKKILRYLFVPIYRKLDYFWGMATTCLHYLEQWSI